MTLKPLLGAALAAALFAGPAQAGFYLEGLQPFAGDYCADGDPAVHGNLVVGAIDWESSSPDASTLNGRVPYTARNCDARAGAERSPRTHRAPVARPYAVPQK